jgi:large subunit ribosomal protein L25
MANQYTLAAEHRDDAGKGASRRLRREGKVPGIIYGGGKAAEGVAFDGNDLLRKMEHEGFFSSILNVNIGGDTMQAFVRDYQIHPARRAVLHLDLQRVIATEKIKIAVPFHFINEAACRGVKESGASISHLLTEIEVSCLPKDLPEYIEIDVGPMGLNDMVHLSDLKLPDGVEIPGLVAGGVSDQPVVHVHVLRIAEEPEPTAAVAAEGAEAAAAGAAAPAEGAAAAGAAAKPGAAPAAGAAKAGGGKPEKK